MANTLPSKIMKMVACLHESGYCDIYLFSGVSPSGAHWRYTIGKIDNDAWPNFEVIVQDSIGGSGSVDWSDDLTSAEGLADDFERHYAPVKSQPHPLYAEYNRWYLEVLKMLKENEALAFYADFEAPHQHLLIDAPGYRRHPY